MTRLIIIVLILGLVGVLVVVAINWRVASYSANRVYNSVGSTPSDMPIAIVLGARVADDGGPSNTLYDRVLTGVKLYNAGKTHKLLLSGGKTEPAVMKKLALDLGVPETDIIIDDLGTRTYETCSRAKQVFAIERAIVVTQDYHLPRTIYLCQNMGIDAIGLNAKRRDYDGEKFAWLREYAARVNAWYDINIRAPSPDVQD